MYVLVLSRATRSLFWTLRSERCVRRPNYGNRALLSERSYPKIGWSGAERWAGVAEKCWSGAERGARGRGAGTERGAEVTWLGWSVERLFRQLRSAHMLCLQKRAMNIMFSGGIDYTTCLIICSCGHTGNSARIPDKTIFFVGEFYLRLRVSIICYLKKMILELRINYAIQRHFNYLL